MLSKYGMICEVVAEGSFTKTAEKYGYAQSSISAAVKSLEKELSTCLIDRRRHKISWTEDGKMYAPYFQAIYTAEQVLERKNREVMGLLGQTIRIGTFTSVSRDILPPLMQKFRDKYPGISFELYQGGYTEIQAMLKADQVNLGFMSEEVAGDLTCDFLYEDRMFAVLPPDHPLAGKDSISFADLSEEPIILLDEGRYSTAQKAFADRGVPMHTAYRVTDDYSILSMVKSHLGVTLLLKMSSRDLRKKSPCDPARSLLQEGCAWPCRMNRPCPMRPAGFASL